MLTAIARRAHVAAEPAPGGSLLLDQFPGAAIAVSSRLKLLAAYSGNAYLCERADLATQGIPFAGDAVDRTNQETFCAGTDGSVHTFNDQSGNDRNVVSTAATQRPRTVVAGVSVTDSTGNPSADWGVATDDMNRALGGVSMPSGFTLAIAGQYNGVGASTDTAIRLVHGADVTNIRGLTPQISIDWGADPIAGGMPANTRFVWIGGWDGTNVWIRWQTAASNAENSAVATPTSTTADTIYIGGNSISAREWSDLADTFVFWPSNLRASASAIASLLLV